LDGTSGGGKVRQDLADHLVNNLLALGGLRFDGEPRRELVAEGQKLRLGDIDHGVDFLANIRDGYQIAHQTFQLKLIPSQVDLFTAGFDLGIRMAAETGWEWRWRGLLAFASGGVLMFGPPLGNFPSGARQLPAGAGGIFASVPRCLGFSGIELPIVGREPAGLHRLRHSFGAYAVTPREFP
jgi:hypothetical protein